MEIDTLDKLHALYGTPKPASTVKVAQRITPQYAAWINASPFCALSTVGPEGTDCTPRGDRGAVVTIEDETTLALPDRRGNDRIDSLRNIVRDPRVSLMFMIPGSATVIRVNGQGRIVADEARLARYAVDGKPPRSVLLVAVDDVYFQCARALIRADLWGGADAPPLPTPGEILAAQSAGNVGGPAYDKAWPERASNTMW
jgi:PPOX class probable FMN-dependent enzyme